MRRNVTLSIAVFLGLLLAVRLWAQPPGKNTSRLFQGYWMGVDPLDGGDSRRGLRRESRILSDTQIGDLQFDAGRAIPLVFSQSVGDVDTVAAGALARNVFPLLFEQHAAMQAQGFGALELVAGA